ncbi:MAG: hypothetical protein H0W27_03065 [Actinobacteria bacterium]|nr:hypothetical protein [Actinomycetota bacterium]
MTARTASRLAWTLWALTLGLHLTTLILGFTVPSVFESGDVAIITTFSIFVLTFATVGALVASKRYRNPIGWLLSASALAYAMGGLSGAAVEYATSAEGATELPAIAHWLNNWVWGVGAALAATFPLLLFPDGHLPSRRWKPIAWSAGIGTAMLAASIALLPGRFDGTRVSNPFGIAGSEDVLDALGAIGLFAVLMSVLASLLSLIVRFRRAGPDERQQLKWLTYAGGVVLACMAASFVVEGSGNSELSNGLVTGGLTALPMAMGIAILKYRLYDIDIVINKTVVYGSLAAFITAVYVAIVVGVGELFGRGDEPNLALSIAATAVIAVAFQPVRERVQRLANRLVYGHRASPYEVLSSLAGHMGEGYSTEDILPRMARILAEGTGARRTAVWMHIGEELRLQAAWPTDQGDEPNAVPSANGGLPTFPAVDRAVPIRHEGELLGALTVTKPRGESLTPAEDALISNLGSHAGLVLRNVRLTEDLLRSAREVRASRKRIVSAQNEERRRLERDIHDGAQQQLVALAVKMGLARQLLSGDPGRAGEVLEETARNSVEALETLRDLARGIYPPLLADQGLGAALAAQARKASLPVEVEAEGVERYEQGIEAAVYFCCLEALQNVTKYAGATQARIRLAGERGRVSFTVGDDGRGFDPATTPPGSGLTNMRDRLAALGGTLEIVSLPGEGTTVTGRVPLASPEPP